MNTTVNDTTEATEPQGEPGNPDEERPYSLEIIEHWVSRIHAVHLERYAEPEMPFRLYNNSILAAAGEPIEEGEVTGLEGADGCGNTVEFTEAEAIDGIRHTGIWGYADTGGPVPVIHYWRSGDSDIQGYCHPDTRVVFFAHELSHAILEPFFDAYQGMPHPELLADVTGLLALQAMRWAQGVNEPAPGD